MRIPSPYLMLLAFCMLSLFANATDYYFAASGNDNNSGTNQNSPFRSLAKASSMTLAPGDKLLFKRGDVFTGELTMYTTGTLANPIIIGSYGQGPDAVISGSEYVNNWVSVGNGIYSASCPVYPQMVFYNGEVQQLAQYPNQGFLFTDAANGANGFSDNDLAAGNNLYLGAGVHIRTSRYRYEERKIATQVNNYLGFDYATAANIVAGAGYYLTGKLNFVDAGGEYYYDEQNQQLYLKTFNGQTPANNTVLASRHDNGIKTDNAANLIIQNIKFNHQQKNGILFLGNPSNNFTIDSCVFENIYLYAITGANKTNVSITNNQFYNIWGGGIFVGGFVDVSISHNLFKRIGTVAPGRATDNLISYKCINMNNSNGVISDNILDSIGNNGIEFFQNTTIERNVISKFCMTTDDGAGIVAFGATNGIRNGTNCFVRNNIISHPVGNAESYPFINEPFVNGIGMDDNSGNAVIENNTIYNVIGRGISIHNSSYNQVRGNTIFNANNGSLVFEHDYNGGMLMGNVASNNVLYNINKNENALKVQNWHQSETGLNFGQYSNNYYINPYNAAPVYTATYGNDINGNYGLLQNNYSVNGWKEGQDAGAKKSPLKLEKYRVASFIGDDLVTNGNFNNNLNGWGCWADNNTCNTVWQSTGALDGGHVKITSPWYNYGNFYNTALIPMQKDRQYQLSFSLMGEANKFASFNVQDRSNWAQLTQRATMEVANTRLNHKILLTPNASTSTAQLTFYIGPEYATTYSLDNIKLQEVTTTSVDPLTQSHFFVNPSYSILTIPLQGLYLDVDSNLVFGSITLQPFTSKVLMSITQAPLPLHIIDINANKVDASSSKIQWSIGTANESCKMELQKSTDALTFTTISSIAIKPNITAYQYMDKDFSSTSFYRIKTECTGEQEHYSNIVQVSKNEDNTLVYPNPLTNDKLTIINNTNYTSAQLYSLDGRQLLKVKIIPGNNAILLPSPLVNGTYFLHLKGNQSSKVFKLVKN